MKSLFLPVLMLGCGLSAAVVKAQPQQAQPPVPALPAPFPADPASALERTCFQTSKEWSPLGNLRSDVALVYGIDAGLPARIKTWQDRGYRTHVMTGVSWGNYQDYLYGKFDGVNHEGNAQTDQHGHKISHGGDVYYMCPDLSFGRYLCVGVQRALDAGAEAIHLEEPEFWDRAGYSEGFKKEWQSYYNEPWQPPHSSVDARWKAGKLKYFLYRRALQQVFTYVQDYNKKTGKKVRCYVPTHSLLNYAHWCIVSPESSLAQLEGCDGYIAQVWTGTARTPQHYRGKLAERTFEYAFLEYGAMQNLVRSTGRSVWCLNDPVEDNPNHDWTDYRRNWENTLIASLLQPDLWQFEVAPWPERVFGWKYPRNGPLDKRQPIPPDYAAELQMVFHALNDMKQPDIRWQCGTPGVGVVVSDSLMFQRGQPTPSDPHMAHLHGLAMPLVKHGVPVTPVQLENVGLKGYLDSFRLLVMSYQGQKPMTPEVHTALADWVKAGGVLVFADDDSDPYLKVREWWNTGDHHFGTPREHLFAQLGWNPSHPPQTLETQAIGKGTVVFDRENPVVFSLSGEACDRYMGIVKTAAAKGSIEWKETNHFLLRRGPWIIAAGLRESIKAPPATLDGRFINLFNPALGVIRHIDVNPDDRLFLLDLDAVKKDAPPLLLSSCRALAKAANATAWTVEGVADTPAVLLVSTPKAPARIILDGQALYSFTYEAENQILRIRFTNTSAPRDLSVEF
ncbi:MAG: hypothetical protein JWM59_3442 [Verrucomicrobiales bacterium]|nr:hypothetical protein [Verrucomicrobiales bacterium]